VCGLSELLGFECSRFESLVLVVYRYHQFQWVGTVVNHCSLRVGKEQIWTLVPRVVENYVRVHIHREFNSPTLRVPV
jgi:hypothetical protein